MCPRSALSITIAILTFTSCRRDPDLQTAPPTTSPPTTPSTPNTPHTSALTFGISGDTVVEVMQARSATVSFFLSDSGAGQPVYIDILGLPAGVGASGSRVTPPGRATIGIRVGPAPGLPGMPTAVPGTYAAAAMARINNGTVKTFPFRFTVLANSSCAELRAGTYSVSGCDTAGMGNVYVTGDTTVTNPRIYLSNFPSSGRGSYADLDCANNTLVFPNQSYGTFRTFSGTGTFTRDTMVGTIYLYNMGVTAPYDSCDFTLRR